MLFPFDCAATGLVSAKGEKKITGVRIREKDGFERELAADMVVDSSGRTSPMPSWLESLGFEKPFEEKLRIDMGYTSRMYRRPANCQRDRKALIVYPKAPLNTKFGYISPVEPDASGERFIVSLAGCGGDYAPSTEEGFLEHAKQLARPELYEYLRTLTPIGDFSHFRFIENRRRRYEAMTNCPEGFMAVGDALCAVNPIYAQGISAIALELRVMEKCLAGGLDGIGRRYFKKVAKTIDVPWFITICEDFRYPHTKGKRPFFAGFLNAYTGKVLEASGASSAVWKTFLYVLHLVKYPAVLFSPHVVFAVIKTTLFRKEPLVTKQ